MGFKISKKAKKIVVGFVFSALAIFLILYFGNTQREYNTNSKNAVEMAENLFYDLFFKASTAINEEEESTDKIKVSTNYDPNILIVDIDEPALTKLGNYNEWDRSIHANVIKKLTDGGAASVSFDILFKNADFGKLKASQVMSLLEAVEPNRGWDSLYPEVLATYNFDSMLVDAVKQSGNVIVCNMFDEKKAYKHESQWRPLSSEKRAKEVGFKSVISIDQIDKPDDIEAKDILDNIFPELAQSGAYMGSVNAYPDNDGIVRHVSMLYRFPNPDILPTEDSTLIEDSQIDSTRVYTTMSLMTVMHLFHQKPENISVRMGKYINLGKPFGIFRDSLGAYHTTYPNFSYPMFQALYTKLKDSAIQKKATNQYIGISSKIIAYKQKSGLINFEIFEGQILNDNLSKALRKLTLKDLQNADDGIINVSKDITLRRDDENEESEDRYILTDSQEEEATITPYIVSTIQFYKDSLNRIPVRQPVHLSQDTAIRFDKAKKRWTSNQVILSDAVIRDIIATPTKNINSLEPGEEIRFGKEKHVPIDKYGRYQVNFKGRYNVTESMRTFQHISYYDVYMDRIDPTFYQGKIFILGSAAAALFDFVAGPQEENYPAVLVHATIIKNILDDDYIVTLDEKHQRIIVILLALLCIILGLFLKSYVSVSVSILLMIIYTFIAYRYFEGGLYIGAAKQMAAILVTNIMAIVVQFYFENKEKSFINKAFKQYISPELIDAMVDKEIMPTLGGEESNITAYFTDIASFSTFSEKIGDPKKLVELLNDYLTEMTDTLLKNQGTLDKYEGDAIIAFFGAPMPLPNHAQSACDTAIDMQNKLIELRKKWASEKIAGENKNEEKNKWPDVVHNMHMRIGINSGDIVTGNMGSTMRKNYTMMGDAVNLASRLESASKQYGAYIQISENTQKELTEGAYLYRSLDTIRVVGKSEPVKTFELLEKAGCENEATLTKLIQIWEKARKCYEQMEWDKAIELFTGCLELEPHHPDKDPGSTTTPSHIYINRCMAYKQTPPVQPGEVWDGVFNATEK